MQGKEKRKWKEKGKEKGKGKGRRGQDSIYFNILDAE